jgi:hypothetical protein
MMPCITVAPRQQTAAVAVDSPMLVHDRSWVGESRSVAVPTLRTRPLIRIRNRTFSSSDCSLARRLLRSSVGVAGWPSSQTGPRPSSSCGVLSDTSRGVRCEAQAREQRSQPKPERVLARVSSRMTPCGFTRMTQTRLRSPGWVPWVTIRWRAGRTSLEPFVDCVNPPTKGRETCNQRGFRVCPERKCLPDPVASMESRSTARRRALLRVVSHPAASLRRGLGLPPWGF